VAMDVIGKKPDDPLGEHFGANIWSWGALHALIDELCPDLLDEETLELMANNNGAGADDQETCTEMAIRM